jgi:hypothetical protein
VTLFEMQRTKERTSFPSVALEGSCDSIPQSK